MYFWNIDKLKAQLIERPMTDRETLPYLIATFLLLTVSEYAPKSLHYNLFDYLEMTMTVIGFLFGTLWLYKKNQAEAGKQFLQRYFSIGWVALTKTIVILMPFMIILLIIASATNINDIDTGTKGWLDNVIVGITLLFYYWYVGKHISDIAQKTTYQKD
jgi:hypothetical protein